MRFALLLVLLFAGHAQAQTVFAPLDAVSVASFPPPPAPGSAVDKQDLAVLMTLNSTRTKAQCASAESQAFCDFGGFFGSALSAEEISKIEPLYSVVFGDTDYFVSLIKNKYNRPRPIQRTSKILLCIDSHPSTSYPSGHAAISRSMALVLGLIFPDRAQTFLKLGNQAAMNRVLGGVHHPSDIRAGRMVGDLVVHSMEKNPKFLAAIKDLKTSLEKH